jgi:hypothetical protein
VFLGTGARGTRSPVGAAPVQRRYFRRHTIRVVIALLYLGVVVLLAALAVASGWAEPPSTGERGVFALLAPPCGRSGSP